MTRLDLTAHNGTVRPADETRAHLLATFIQDNANDFWDDRISSTAYHMNARVLWQDAAACGISERVAAIISGKA